VSEYRSGATCVPVPTLAHGWVASLVNSKKRFCLFVVVNKLYSMLNFTPKCWRYIQGIYLTSTLTKESVDREFESRSCQDSLNLYATLRRKSNDWVVRNQDDVSEYRSGATCVPVNCWLRYIQGIYLTSTLTKECCSVGCFYVHVWKRVIVV
jgi:hypothetical protein